MPKARDLSHEHQATICTNINKNTARLLGFGMFSFTAIEKPVFHALRLLVFWLDRSPAIAEVGGESFLILNREISHLCLPGCVVLVLGVCGDGAEGFWIVGLAQLGIIATGL